MIFRIAVILKSEPTENHGPVTIINLPHSHQKRNGHFAPVCSALPLFSGLLELQHCPVRPLIFFKLQQIKADLANSSVQIDIYFYLVHHLKFRLVNIRHGRCMLKLSKSTGRDDKRIANFETMLLMEGLKGELKCLIYHLDNRKSLNDKFSTLHYRAAPYSLYCISVFYYPGAPPARRGARARAS